MVSWNEIRTILYGTAAGSLGDAGIYAAADDLKGAGILAGIGACLGAGTYVADRLRRRNNSGLTEQPQYRSRLDDEQNLDEGHIPSRNRSNY